MKFNWEDYQARVAEYVLGGMDQQSAELQVQHEMEDEQVEYEDWVRDMEEDFSPYVTMNS